jgi:hypothetical protein
MTILTNEQFVGLNSSLHSPLQDSNSFGTEHLVNSERDLHLFTYLGHPQDVIHIQTASEIRRVLDIFALDIESLR